MGGLSFKKASLIKANEMVFWGIEVKPGKSFTQHYDKTQGRLHISLANLGWGTNPKKSVLQCNIGNKAPIILCHLCPEKADSCQLHVEFDEDVTFSVVGPRSVHLAGYYIGGRPRQNLVNDDDTESYGEDIGETETERSADSSEEECEDDFIDDGEPEVFPPSPSPIMQVNRNGKKRLQKKHMVIYSSSDDCSQNENFFWEDEYTAPKTSQNAKTDGLNILKPRNSEDKSEEKKHCTIQQSGELDSFRKKKKNKKRKKVVKNGGDNLNGTVLQDDKMVINEENICSNSKSRELPADVDVPSLKITDNNLIIEKLSSGQAGAEVAVDGSKVSIYYCGKLENGEIIDSNIGKRPYNFTLGNRQFIKGWDAGISGMQIGEKRRLAIPPSMGFGSREVEGVPKNSWLYYDIELVDVL